MTELLFHTPWWLPTLIFAAGIAVFVTGNKRTDVRTRAIGLGVICLAILLGVVSYFVDTPVEKAVKDTKAMIAAFERQDYPGMTAILERDTTVSVLGTTVYASEDDIIAHAKIAQQRYQFKAVRVLSTNAKQIDTEISVTVVILSEQSAGMVNTLNSEWQFDWRKSAEGWGLVEIRALKIGQTTGDQIRGIMPRR